MIFGISFLVVRCYLLTVLSISYYPFLNKKKPGAHESFFSSFSVDTSRDVGGGVKHKVLKNKAQMKFLKINEFHIGEN